MSGAELGEGAPTDDYTGAALDGTPDIGVYERKGGRGQNESKRIACRQEGELKVSGSKFQVVGVVRVGSPSPQPAFRMLRDPQIGPLPKNSRGRQTPSGEAFNE